MLRKFSWWVVRYSPTNLNGALGVSVVHIAKERLVRSNVVAGRGRGGAVYHVIKTSIATRPSDQSVQ